MIPRSIYSSIWEQLAAEKAMVFMAGPRQVGKTTLARSIAEPFTNKLYFNWDVVTDRARLAKDAYFFKNMERRDDSKPIVILDEIHKYRDWKNYLKGVYDGFHREYHFLIAGSGRLDTYRKGGDSLAGRYAMFRLWPLTLAELVSDRRETLEAFWDNPLAVAPDRNDAAGQAWGRLRNFTGFPEPYARARHPSYRRWSTSYASQLIREDIRDLTAIRLIGDVETLFALLPERVGSSLSFQSLSEDLKVSYNTVRNWVETLERFFLVFSITPWTRKVARAIHKARKTYLFDYGRIENPALRFENMIALELFRAVNTWNDLGLGSFGLHFVRTKEGLEVDFLVTNNRKPLLLVEAKAKDAVVPKALRKIQSQLRVPAVQVLDQGDTFRRHANGDQAVLVVPATMWLPRFP
jgi:predicted AAA+ superfamily ATPase